MGLSVDRRGVQVDASPVRVLIAFAALLISVAGVSARAVASPAVGGGHYRGTARGPNGVRVKLDVRLANDAREFVPFSALLVDFVPCNVGGLQEFWLDDRGISAVGEFGRRSSKERSWFRGRFVARGRRIVGTFDVALTGASSPGCTAKGRMTAHLVARASPPRPDQPVRCEPVWPNGYRVRIDVWTRGAHCTAARQLARRWYRQPDCHGLPVGGDCRLATHTCTAIASGSLHPTAAARCNGAQVLDVVELAQPTACDTEIWVSIATSCDTGMQLASTLITNPPPPGDACALGDRRAVTCSLSGYRCRVHEGVRDPLVGSQSASTGWCRSDADPHMAFEFGP
jgi:hypothetical protein